MELQRREHERPPPQAGSRQVDPCQKQEMPERSAAGPLEVLAVKVKEEMTGGESRVAVVDGVVYVSSDSDSDNDSDSDYDAEEELLMLGNTRTSMIEGRNQEKLTGKKRTADDMLQEDSQESGNKKLTIKDNLKFEICSQPEKICEAVALLNEPQREKVKELGFESLLDFRMDRRGPWKLIIWLMDHLETDDQDPDTMVLHFGGNRKLSITQDTVNSVLGLQKGKLDPPSRLTNTYKLSRLRNKLDVPEGKRIEVDDLLKKIKSGGTDKFTIQCFMMVVFCTLMDCATSRYITHKAWAMVNTDFDKFGQMNWCKFVVDQIKYSAFMWKKPGDKKKTVYGCSAFLVMYYLDNLNCEHKMRCVEVPRAKFFSGKMIEKLVTADMLEDEDDLPTFGKLTLRNQRGTCYDKRAESSRDVTTYMPIPGTSNTDIVGTFRSPHNQIQIDDLSSHQSLCPSNKDNTKQQQFHITQIGEPQEREEENEDGLNGYDKKQTMACNSSELLVHQETDGDIAMATQGTTPPQEAFHGDPKVSAVPQGEHEVTGGSEDSYRHVLVHSVQGASEDVVQLASISMKEQVNDFMGDSSEPGIVKKLDSPLPQIQASVALGVRTSDLEQQVQELTKKLSNNEKELEATREMLRGAQSTIANKAEEVLEGSRAKLRTAQVFQLEAQSAVAAINFLALRLSATFVRLGSDPPSPSSVVGSSSLGEAVKLLDDLVSRIEPVSHNYATSLARSSVGFVAAALLSRDGEKVVKALHNAVGADTRRFVQSQGPEFHSLVAQVVDAVVQKQQHGNDAANTRS